MSITTLLALAARLAGTANGAAVTLRNGTRALAFMLNVSACGTDAGDTQAIR